MSSCSFEKNAFKVFSSKNRRSNMTWQKNHDFHNFSNSGLKFYMRISECICNLIMMKKKYRFFDPFTGSKGSPQESTCFILFQMYRLGPRPSATSKNLFDRAHFERLNRKGEGSENFGKWFLYFGFMSIKHDTNFNKIRGIVC